jgi:hypothetical protein
VSKWCSEDVVKLWDVYDESEGLWNIRHSDYNSKIKRDIAILKLMGELLKRNVAVESVEVLRKKIKSIFKKTCTGKSLRRSKKEVEEELTMFINLNLRGLRGPIFS